MAPAATPAPESPQNQLGTASTTWSGLVDQAMRERSRQATDPQAIVRAGEVQAQALCRYAAGRVTQSERRDVEGFLSRSLWAQERVSALVRGRRGADPLAGALLAAAEQGEVDPYRVAAGALLDSLDRADVRPIIEREDPAGLDELAQDPLLRAACLLGLRRLDEARDAFAELTALPSPVAEAARRLTSLPEDDEALVELLAAL